MQCKLGGIAAHLSLQRDGIYGPGGSGDMADEVIAQAPLVHDGPGPAQVLHQAGQGQLLPLHHLLAAPGQGRVARGVQHHQLHGQGHGARPRRVDPDAGEVAVEVAGDVLQQQLAGVNVAEVLLPSRALGQLLQEVFVHEPGAQSHEDVGRKQEAGGRRQEAGGTI